jgi:hypothetical protein
MIAAPLVALAVATIVVVRCSVSAVLPLSVTDPSVSPGTTVGCSPSRFTRMLAHTFDVVDRH